MLTRYQTWRQSQNWRDLLQLLGHRLLGPTWAVLALSAVATGLATWVTLATTRQAATAALMSNCSRIADELDDNMSTYLHALRAGRGLLSAFAVGSETRRVSPSLTQAQWRAFVSELDLQRTLPGVQGTGYVIVLNPDHVAAHEHEMRLRGFADYTVRPAGPRDIVTSIVYLEPEDWRNRRAIGFDMFSEPVRRAAMEAARDTGRATMSAPVTLVQETAEDTQPGVLVYVPVYSGSPQSLQDRLEQLVGFIYAAFRSHDLVSRVLASRVPSLLPRLHLHIKAPTGDGDVTLFGTANSVPGAASRTIMREIVGQRWEITCTSAANDETPLGLVRPLTVLAIGSLFSFLLTFIAGSLAVGRARAEEAQAKLQAEVERRAVAEKVAKVANQELLHRVKNQMAVVSSIATQTARYTPEPRQFVSTFRDRLAALGRVNDLLKANPGFRPDLVRLVGEVMAPFSAGRGGEVFTAEGEPVEINQNAAVMLSIVLNELASNALRHGALSRRGGRVALSWRLMASNAVGITRSDPVVEITWRESGGPRVAEPRHRGFGSNVLRFTIEQALKGTFSPQFAPEGFTCTLTFPVVPPDLSHPPDVTY